MNRTIINQQTQKIDPKRCNLRIDVVVERKNETCQQYENEVQNISKEKLGLENFDVEREYIPQKERRVGTDKELLFVSMEKNVRT